MTTKNFIQRHLRHNAGLKRHPFGGDHPGNIVPAGDVLNARPVQTGSMTINTAPAAVAAQDITKTYGTADTKVAALNEVSVAFRPGDFTAIMGPSGSGKSTLMHCLAGLDTVDSGRVAVNSTVITGMSDHDLTILRRKNIGFIFQAFNLVPTLNARDNILLPLDLAGTKVDQAWFDQIVDILGLADRLSHKPHELSGGQQQRVAVARALLTRPAWSSLTNQPAPWTQRPGPKCCNCWPPALAKWARPSLW